MLAMPKEVVNIAKTSSQNRVRSAVVKLQIARNSMTDVYTDTEYNVTMLAVLAEHRGFVIRKMPLKFGTGGIKMNELTLDEAIKHCLEVAEQKEHDSITTTGDYKLDIAMKEGCIQCATDHRRLAEWLMELKDLRAEQNDQYVFIHELMSELKEAKRLLKAAVEDMHIEDMCDVCVERIPNSPIHCPDGSDCFVWRYKDEALKLIGEDVNGI